MIFNELTIELADANWQGYLASRQYVDLMVVRAGDYHNYMRHKCRYLGIKNAARGGCWALIRRSKLYKFNKQQCFLGACRGGHLDIVTWLIEEKKLTDVWDAGLIQAIKGNHLSIFSYLLDKMHMHMHMRCNIGHNAITVAYKVGNHSMINILESISIYKYISISDKLRYAMIGKHTDIIYDLLSKLDPDNKKLDGYSMGINGDVLLLKTLELNGYSLDHVACYLGALVANNDEMIAHCTNITGLGISQVISFASACEVGRLWMVQEIIQKFINHPIDYNMGLWLACSKGHTSVVSYLLTHFTYKIYALIEAKDRATKKYRFDIVDLIDVVIASTQEPINVPQQHITD